MDNDWQETNRAFRNIWNDLNDLQRRLQGVENTYITQAAATKQFNPEQIRQDLINNNKYSITNNFLGGGGVRIIAGTLQPTDERPTNLGEADANKVVFYATDVDNMLRWTGTTWLAIDYHSGSIVAFEAAPTSNGWRLCNGSGTVDVMQPNGSFLTIAVPLLTGNTYLRMGSSYSGPNPTPATAPSLSGSPALTGSPGLTGTPEISMVNPGLGGAPTIELTDPAITGAPSVTMGTVAITGAPSVTIGAVTISGSGVAISGHPNLTGVPGLIWSIVGIASGYLVEHAHPIDNLVGNNGSFSVSQPYDWNLHNGTIWYPTGTIDGDIPAHVHGYTPAGSVSGSVSIPGHEHDLTTLHASSSNLPGASRVSHSHGYDVGLVYSALNANITGVTTSSFVQAPINTSVGDTDNDDSVSIDFSGLQADETTIGTVSLSGGTLSGTAGSTTSTSSVDNGLSFTASGETHYHRVTGNSSNSAASFWPQVLTFVDTSSSFTPGIGSLASTVGTMDLDYTKIHASTPTFTWNNVGTLAGGAPSFTWVSNGSLAVGDRTSTWSLGTLAIIDAAISWLLGTLDGTIGSLGVTAGTLTPGSNGEPQHMTVLPYLKR